MSPLNEEGPIIETNCNGHKTLGRVLSSVM
jgi:hypothetical protein